MSAQPDDIDPVSDDYRRLRVDELIRLFAHHRDNGDEGRMRAVWAALVMRTWDRVVAAVKSFKFPNGARMPHHQRDDAIQEAYFKALAMAGTFAGTSEGEYKAALHRCVWFACMDVGREDLKHEQATRARLHDPAFDQEEGGGDRGRWDEELEAEARRRQEELLDKLEDEARLHRERDLVAWGIGQVANDNYREVLEMTYLEGLSGEDIAARLGIEIDNVYQRRRRAKKELEKILDDRRT